MKIDKAVAVHLDLRNVVLTMCVLIGVLVVLYIVLVNQTVHNIVERRTLETDSAALSSQVSELEFTYMRHKNSITSEKAHEIGFIEAQKVTYISRTPVGAVVTLNR